MQVSVTELSKSGGHTRGAVLRVPEWWAISGAPRELGAHTGGNTVLNIVRWHEVADFEARVHVDFFVWHKLQNFVVGHSGHFSSVAHGLELLKMLTVVGKVESVVPLHGNIEGLHLFGGVSAFGDSSINAILGLEELLVLGLDLINNTWSVNVVSVSVPVDGSLLESGGLVWFVKVVEERLELTMILLSFVSSGTCAESSQPVASNITCCIKCHYTDLYLPARAAAIPLWSIELPNFCLMWDMVSIYEV